MIKNFFIIDGMSLCARSHFANPLLRSSSGLSSGCIYGFFNSLKSLKKKYPQFHFYIAWDSYAKRKRKIYAQYKAFRPKLSLDLQVFDIRSILSCLNVSQAFCEGEEGDDVIASLVEQFKKNNPEVLIYILSSDKDMLQLVEKTVVVISPGKGGEEKAYDAEAVKEKFGVYPENFALFQAFRGDKIDNVPGIKNLPSKVITDLVGKYKTLDLIFSSVNNEELTKFQNNAILSSEKQIYINYELVKLSRSLDLSIIDGKPETKQINNLLKKYEIEKISADQLTKIFESESGFPFRTAPQIESYNLFEEGEIIDEEKIV